MHDPHTAVCPVLVRSFRVPCAYRRAADDHATMSFHCPPVTSLKLGRASEQSPSLFLFLSACLAGSVCICLYDLQAEHQPWLRLASSFSPTLFSPSFFFSAVPRRERSSQELHCPVVLIFGRALFFPHPLSSFSPRQNPSAGHERCSSVLRAPLDPASACCSSSPFPAAATAPGPPRAGRHSAR